MKKILFVLSLMFFFTSTSYAQEQHKDTSNDPIVTNSFWSNWYLQAGLDMTLLNPYGCNFSNVFPKGKTFGLNVGVGKWFSPEISIRARFNWENGFPLFRNDHIEWLSKDNMDEGGFIMICGDVLINLHNIIAGYDDKRKWNMLVFPRAGFISNLGIGSSSPVVGVGIGSTYRLNKRLSLYADIAYQLLTSEFFDGLSTTGMGVSKGSNGFFNFNIGVQWDLGKNIFNRQSDYK